MNALASRAWAIATAIMEAESRQDRKWRPGEELDLAMAYLTVAQVNADLREENERLRAALNEAEVLMTDYFRDFAHLHPIVKSAIEHARAALAKAENGKGGV